MRNKPLILVAIGLSLIIFATAVRADDPPKFRAGLWEFKRTIEGQGKPMTMNTQNCTDPTESMKKHEIPGCKFSPLARSGNSYTFTADCKLSGVDMHSKSVIVAESDGAYRLTVESQAGDRKGREVLIAKRIGDCKK